MAIDREKPEIGILWVHGIGQQRRGDTLAAWTEALQSWLRRWWSSAPNPEQKQLRPSIRSAKLTESDLQSKEPPNAILSVSDDDSTVSSWLFAESHWAEVFNPPTYLQLLFWAVTHGPRSMLLKFARPLQTAEQDKEQGNSQLNRFGAVAGASWLALPAWCLFLPIFLIGLALIPLVSWIPIESVRALAVRAKEVLSGIAGDSLIFAAHPVFRSAIITKFNSDLRWLSNQCDRIIIVAHSQGAAVVYEALRDSQPNTVKAIDLHLVTFGAGLRKLFDLLPEQNENPKDFYDTVAFQALAAWVAVILTYVVVIAAWIALDPFSMSRLILVLLTAAVVLALLLVLLVLVAIVIRPQYFCLRVNSWQDYYSTHDPVPSGPLMSFRQTKEISKTQFGEEVPKSIEVFNKGSVFSDHTTYWQSDEDFVARIAKTILDKSSLISSSHNEALVSKIHLIWRAWRMRIRRALRFLTLLTIAAIAIFQRSEIEGLGKAMSAVLEQYYAHLGEGVGKWLSPDTIGFLAVALLILVAWQLALFGFNQWEQKQISSYFSRKEPELICFGSIQLVVFAMTISLTPLILQILFGAAAQPKALVLSFLLVFFGVCMVAIRKTPWQLKRVSEGDTA